MISYKVGFPRQPLYYLELPEAQVVTVSTFGKHTYTTINSLCLEKRSEPSNFALFKSPRELYPGPALKRLAHLTNLLALFSLNLSKWPRCHPSASSEDAFSLGVSLCTGVLLCSTHYGPLPLLSPLLQPQLPQELLSLLSRFFHLFECLWLTGSFLTLH